jgi:HAE1 family hydrophobic/amphiphilic exporter-1
MPPHDDSGGGISGLAIRRPTFTAMVMLGLVVLGLFSYIGLPIDQYPDVDIPVVTVQTTYAGASPETMERDVTRRLEEAFNSVEGVDTISSVSLEGVSQVIIQFDLGRDVDQAAADVRAKIDVVRPDLPDDIDPPLVQKFNPADQPIVSLALSSDSLPLGPLTTLADETVRRRIEAVPGVGSVEVAGGLERQIRVYVVPHQLQALGVSLTDVIGALQRQNLEVPAGRVESGPTEQLVRVTGRISDPQQFSRVIVATRGDNPVRLGEVARVEDATEEERSLALVDGERAVSLDVVKVAGGNTVAVADAITDAIRELQAALPEGVRLRVVRDNSVEIRQSVEAVIEELVLGAVLTIVIVMLFLNDWKATVITSLALPVSVISSFVLMGALGFTLNILTLMALSLSIGILIDDAIVVVENIVRRRQIGDDTLTAAREGTSEIFFAVLATTLSIVAVFVPVAFMGGIIGRFFFQFGLTIAWAVLVSLFVSFTLTPMMSAWWGVSPHDPAHRPRNPLSRLIGGFNRWFDRQSSAYRGIIAWALDHRRTTIAVAILSLVGALALFPFIGGGFMPTQDNSQFTVQFETPEGSSLPYTRGKAEQIVRTLGAIPGVDYTYTTVGAGATGTVTSGEIYVRLVPGAERDTSQQALMVQARDLLTPIAGTTVAVLEAGGVGGAAAPLQVQIRGADVTELQRLSQDLAAAMRMMPGIVDVQSSLSEPRPEFRIDVNRDVANAVGLDIGQIASTVRPVLAGQTVTTWQDPTGESRDVVVQVAAEQRTSLQDIQQIPIATARRTDAGVAVTVPLGELATVSRGTAPAQINRERLQRVATISAGTTPDYSVSEASAAIRARAAQMTIPAGYTITLGGETENLEETTGYVVQAILLAVILIFLILASQFESVMQPIAVMLSLPLSLIGVLLALLVTDDTLNMMSMIGVILLFGLVTKNAILLVDNANERRNSGRDRRTALIEAGEARLRPIMMTTLAMIFGMLPIALALGEGGGFRAPMARAVIGGLITSTMLTLIVVPVAYSYFDDFSAWLRRSATGMTRTMTARGADVSTTARSVERDQRGRLHGLEIGE